MAHQTSTKGRERRRLMTPTKIFRKSAAAYEVARIVAILFWLPIISMALAAIYINW
jgi:hypothetical protein